MVQIGLQVDALDALRLKEHFATKCIPLGTVDGGCGSQIGANLVLLENQPSGPLNRGQTGKCSDIVAQVACDSLGLTNATERDRRPPVCRKAASQQF